MSRTSTPTATKSQQAQAAKPQSAAAAPPTCAMQDKIAMLAYEKWIQKGCQHGNNQQDWLEAEAEVKAEMNKGGARS